MREFSDYFLDFDLSQVDTAQARDRLFVIKRTMPLLGEALEQGDRARISEYCLSLEGYLNEIGLKIISSEFHKLGEAFENGLDLNYETKFDLLDVVVDEIVLRINSQS